MDLPAQLAGAIVAVSCAALVVLRAASAPAPRPLRPATAQERARFAASIAAQEHDWRAKSEGDFPADNWSQRDAFHGHEANAVRELARGAGVPYEDVLRAIDDDLHRAATRNDGGKSRSVSAVPCKPRPIFD